MMYQIAHRTGAVAPHGARIVAAVLAALSMWTSPAHAAGVSDNEVKAALVLKLPQYITFQEDWFDGGRSELVIGVMGNQEFFASAKALYKGSKIQGRRVRLIDVREDAQREKCQVIYVDSSVGELTDSEISELVGLDAVVITNSKHVSSRGTMVHLHLRERKYAIEINLDVANRKDVKFNSQLLRIATITRDEK
jgi:YfiR/HmsC-like